MAAQNKIVKTIKLRITKGFEFRHQAAIFDIEKMPSDGETQNSKLKFKRFFANFANRAAQIGSG